MFRVSIEVVQYPLNRRQPKNFGWDFRFPDKNLGIHLDNFSTFLSKEDTILYTSCFDANGGLFETLFDENDIIISDALNHASIIDGVRLCKAQRAVYPNSNMDALETILKNNHLN